MKNNLFYKYLVEEPGDEMMGDSPPDFGDDMGGGDMGDLGDMGDMGDMPPDDMPDYDPAGDMDNGAASGDMGDMGFGGEEGQDDQQNQNGQQQNQEPMKLSDKVSALMNAKLYKEYLSLLNKIETQSNIIKENRDIFYTISSDSINILNQLKKLDDNIRSYIDISFMEEDYSKNQLFFNKCINLYKFINEDFQSLVNKGINELDV